MSITTALFVCLAVLGPLGAQVPAYEVAGIRLGMPLRQAMEKLKQHNANLKVVPDNLAVPGMAQALTYGINAVGGGEGFYLLLSTPPAEPAVVKVTHVMHFGQESMPRQDVVTANLVKQFGRPSFDTLPASLTLGSRELLWVDDAAGNRVQAGLFHNCRGHSTFFLNGAAAGRTKQYDPVNVRLPATLARLRAQQGYTNASDKSGDECGKYTVVRARLFGARAMGVRVPNLIDYLVVMIASGPMDRKATNETHEYLKRERKLPQ